MKFPFLCAWSQITETCFYQIWNLNFIIRPNFSLACCETSHFSIRTTHPYSFGILLVSLHFLQTSVLLENELELYFMSVACRALDLHHLMGLQNMANSHIQWVISTQHSRPPSLTSPQCTWLEARWPNQSTTTCVTPSSPCCAASCHLELLPSSTPSSWVWFSHIYTHRALS